MANRAPGLALHLLLHSAAIDHTFWLIAGAAGVGRGAAITRIQTFASWIALNASRLVIPATSDE